MNKKYDECQVIRDAISCGIEKPLREGEKCIGYGGGEGDDEPCDECKNCSIHVLVDEEQHHSQSNDFNSES
ncbi:MAG: hypothetical protein RR547_12190 [Raoultibacter sp.]